jgi:PAS domain S-box-containing protein
MAFGRGILVAVQPFAEVWRESEKTYRNLFKTMAQGVVYQDAKGNIISANPAAERILGLSFDQMIGRTSMDPRWKAIHEDGSDFSGETHPAMVSLDTGEEIKDVLMGVFNPEDEDYRWISVNAVPVFREGEDKPYQVYTTFDDITALKRAEGERENLIKDLQKALDDVKTLSGLLPICMSCKKVRDDKGYWNQIELYIRDHSEADFSHGICPECVKKLYPDLEILD